eukprot:TRINITY_DN4399_c0_g1_i1.p1 TRINITY_DN4399_c0_g1~~TRINITY_DN4399_c0_g1_i1.p1  ORF type:complete len:168 (+),score=21.05 TRINITY_DN4399_c0_g1_i1:135-638(+)
MAPYLNVSFEWPIIVVCVIVDVLTGMLWYGPLFGDAFTAGVNGKRVKAHHIPREENMIAAMISSVATSFMQTWFLAHALPHLLYGVEDEGTVVLDPVHAVMGAAWLWAGFKLSSYIEDGMWKSESISVILIDAGRQLLRLCSIAVILASSTALTLTLDGEEVVYTEE